MKVSAFLALVLCSCMLTTAGCSDDEDCPTCPPAPDAVQAVVYDDFDDDALDNDLWGHSIAYGGRVLETSGQLQVWGHTDSWTGLGVAWTEQESYFGWRFVLTEEYFEDGPGCQGWHIRATDASRSVRVEFLNHVTAGCASTLAPGATAGTYMIRRESDSLAVYLDDILLRRLHDNGIGRFKIELVADNVYGSGDHCHIFIDDVERFEFDW